MRHSSSAKSAALERFEQMVSRRNEPRKINEYQINKSQELEEKVQTVTAELERSETALLLASTAAQKRTIHEQLRDTREKLAGFRQEIQPVPLGQFKLPDSSFTLYLSSPNNQVPALIERKLCGLDEEVKLQKVEIVTLGLTKRVKLSFRTNQDLQEFEHIYRSESHPICGAILPEDQVKMYVLKTAVQTEQSARADIERVINRKCNQLSEHRVEIEFKPAERDVVVKAYTHSAHVAGQLERAVLTTSSGIEFFFFLDPETIYTAYPNHSYMRITGLPTKTFISNEEIQACLDQAADKRKARITKVILQRDRNGNPTGWGEVALEVTTTTNNIFVKEPQYKSNRITTSAPPPRQTSGV